MKKRSFFFHYNKPASRAAGSPKLSLHFKDACHIVDHIHCHVGTETKHRKRQPYCVITGKCFGVKIYLNKKGSLAILV